MIGHTRSVATLVLCWRLAEATSQGQVVAQLVEALCYKPEGRGVNSRWCNWNFSLTYS